MGIIECTYLNVSNDPVKYSFTKLSVVPADCSYGATFTTPVQPNKGYCSVLIRVTHIRYTPPELSWITGFMV